MSEQTALQPQPAANGDRNLRDLDDGEAVEAVFAVRERELRQRRNGEDYLRLSLSDRTGSVPAVAWEGAGELFELAEPGSAVRVSGRYSVHARYGPQIKVDSIAALEPGQYDPSQLAEAPAVPVERLEADLRELIGTVQQRDLRTLLDRLLGADAPGWERFRASPAAKYYHEAYPGGLLEHTLSVAHGVSAAAALFRGIDRDVAVTGALLHDIGKTEAYNDEPLAIELTDAGRLQGEIALGYFIVRREIEAIEGFDPGLAQAVLHIVLSHHGALEHGSPVLPATREATLVHQIDKLGGKLGSFDRIERELPDGESWSRFDRGIDSAAYFGARAA